VGEVNRQLSAGRARALCGGGRRWERSLTALQRCASRERPRRRRTDEVEVRLLTGCASRPPRVRLLESAVAPIDPLVPGRCEGRGRGFCGAGRAWTKGLAKRA